MNELAGHETGRRGDPSCAALRGGERSGCPLEGGEAWGGRDSGHAAVPESDPCLAAGAQETLRKWEAFLLAWPAEEAGLLPGPV